MSVATLELVRLRAVDLLEVARVGLGPCEAVTVRGRTERVTGDGAGGCGPHVLVCAGSFSPRSKPPARKIVAIAARTAPIATSARARLVTGADRCRPRSGCGVGCGCSSDIAYIMPASGAVAEVSA